MKSLVFLLALVSPIFARNPPPIPDFTQGGKTDGTHDWVLGATGASGWIYAYKHTDTARQILVTKVETGSPADGLLAPNDVILGIAGQPFQSDARITFARALAKAETGGLLPFLRWRDGKTTTVKLKIPILGNYSETAPYDCPKSAKIFTAGCEAIARKGLSKVSIDENLNALALLASGDPKYKTILAEYVLATGDQSVLPGLERLALESAEGQSTVGTWSHKFALPDGRPAGYGAMNSPGLTLTLGMALAREAGVKDPTLDKAIAKSAAFTRWCLDKGAIPYGDHTPWPGHEDNGKCSTAAVLYDLLGDAEATGFFAKMSLAAYDERERGHTGNFFNILWALPGVDCGGPLATAAYWKEHSWYYDLARRPDGSFRYQGSPVGEEEHKKYTNWDNTGTYLLAYALPRKSLYITGKKKNTIPPFTATEVAEVAEGIDAGRGYFSDKKDDPFRYDKRPTKTLLAATEAGLKNEDGRARSNFGRVLKGIPFEDLTPILPAIHQAIAESAPSGIMFSHGIQMDGLELFTKKKVSEGIELIVNFAHHQKKHGSQARLPILMNMLKSYGTHAQRAIPALEAMAADFENGEDGFPGRLSKEKAALVRKTIEEIKAATATPELIEINP